MRKIHVLAAAVAAFALQAAPASAVTLVATWTGTVTGMSTNFTSRMGFGVLESLFGKEFTAQYTYDTMLGQFTGSNTGERRRGGDLTPFGPSPVLNAWLEIAGGNRITLTPHTTGSIQSLTGQAFFVRTQELTGAAALSSLGLNANFNASGHLEQLLPLTAISGAGIFQFASFNPTLGFDTVDAQGSLAVRSLMIAEYVAPPPPPPPTGTVPEPSTWALLILGFGTVGTLLRRRRDVARLA